MGFIKSFKEPRSSRTGLTKTGKNGRKRHAKDRNSLVDCYSELSFFRNSFKWDFLVFLKTLRGQIKIGFLLFINKLKGLPKVYMCSQRLTGNIVIFLTVLFIVNRQFIHSKYVSLSSFCVFALLSAYFFEMWFWFN